MRLGNEQLRVGPLQGQTGGYLQWGQQEKTVCRNRLHRKTFYCFPCLFNLFIFIIEAIAFIEKTLFILYIYLISNVIINR